MKDKLKEFFQTKKELFVFLGLIALTFIAVITIAEVTMYNDDQPVIVDPDLGLDEDVTDTPNSNDEDVTDTPDSNEEVVNSTFTVPTITDCIIVRDFFDFTTPGSNSNAYIETSTSVITSTGISYATSDNTSFDVVTIYPGKVLDIVEDEVMGTTITVDHGDNLISVYYSLESACVFVGDILETNTKIGISGASAFDINAGVHVHVEVISTIDNEYINLMTIIGKTMDDIASSIK